MRPSRALSLPARARSRPATTFRGGAVLRPPPPACGRQGINRGFLGALDCADMVRRAAPLLITPLGRPPASMEDFRGVLQRREELFALTKRISGANRQKELKPHIDGSRNFLYTLEPSSRYTSWSESPDANAACGRATMGTGALLPTRTPTGAVCGASGRTATGPPRMMFHVNAIPPR